MKILALEFSSEQRSVAVSVDGEVRGGAQEMATRGGRAFGLIEQSLAQAGVEREEIEGLVVGLGPGSYGGIRSAIALAQGWQLAAEIKLLGLASVECLAAEAHLKGWFGAVNIVIDAQRNELYLARYEIDAKGYRETGPLKLAGVGEVREQSAQDELIIGPEATRWFAGARLLFPGAAGLCQLAGGRTHFIPGEKLEPIYLRETNFVKAPPPRVLPPV